MTGYCSVTARQRLYFIDTGKFDFPIHHRDTGTKMEWWVQRRFTVKLSG